MDAAEKRTERRRIEEEAASLVVGRFARGGDAAASPAALRWAAQSPVHGVALAQAQAAWAAAERLRAVAPRDGKVATAHRPGLRRPSRRTVIGGGLAAAMALPLAFGASRLLGGRRLETAIGERRSFALEDGSVVHLNTGTLVEVATGSGRQVATLLRGEAMFDLAATAARPLTVMAGVAVLDAFRSAFDLSLYGDLAKLVVARGVVTVLAEGRTHAVLHGSSAAIERGAVAVAALPPDAVSQRLAWRRGVVDLDGRTLAQAAEEFSRYRSHPIVVADPGVASLRLGGTFATDEGEAFVEAVQRSFPVTAVRSDDGSILLMPSSCSASRTCRDEGRDAP